VIRVDATPRSRWQKISDKTKGFLGNPAVQFLVSTGAVSGAFALAVRRLRGNKKKKPGEAKDDETVNPDHSRGPVS
jgi:hypothetical protein